MLQLIPRFGRLLGNIWLPRNNWLRLSTAPKQLYKTVNYSKEVDMINMFMQSSYPSQLTASKQLSMQVDCLRVVNY